MTIKADHKDLLQRLMRLDMNVVVTCRSKTEYEIAGGEMMRRVGTTFDRDKLFRSRGPHVSPPAPHAPRHERGRHLQVEDRVRDRRWRNDAPRGDHLRRRKGPSVRLRHRSRDLAREGKDPG